MRKQSWYSVENVSIINIKSKYYLQNLHNGEIIECSVNTINLTQEHLERFNYGF